MRPQYDGEIRIDTKINTKSATSQLLTLENKMVKTSQKIAEITSKMKQMEIADVKTDAYRNLEISLQRANDELRSYVAKENEMISLGLNFGTPWEHLIEKETVISEKIDEITGKMMKLEQSGGAFKNQTDTDAYKRLGNDLINANNEMLLLNKKHDELLQKQGMVTNRLNGMGTLGKKTFSSLISFIKRFGSDTNRTTGAIEKMKSRIWELTKSVFIYSMISKAYREMIACVEDGLKNYARYSTGYNKEISDMVSATETLKNSLATAFAPITEVVIPYLTAFINELITASNYTSMFIATLQGKSTYTKAIRQNKDYADSLGGVSSAANKARGALASFDDLDVWSDSSSSGGGSSTTDPSDMFEEESLPDSMGSFLDSLLEEIESGDWESVGRLIAERINEAVSDIDFADIGKNVGIAFNKAFQTADGFLSNIDTESIGAGLAVMLNTAMENIDEELVGKTAAEAINRIFDFAFGFLSTFDFKAAGKELGGIINGFFENIDLGEAGKNVSLLAEGILDFFTNAVEEVEWVQVGEKIGEFFRNIDWFEILKGCGDLVEAAIKGVFDTAIGFAKGLFKEEEKAKSLAEQLAESVQENYQNILGEFNELRDIADEYYTMSQDYDSLTDEQKKMVQEYADLMVEKLGDDVVQSIDSVTGAYKGTKESLDELISSTEDYYMTLAAKDTMLRLYSEITDAIVKQKEATDDFSESLNSWSDTWGSNKDFYFGQAESLEEMANGLIEYVEMMDSYTGPMSDYKDTLEELYGDTIADAIEKSYEYAKAIQEQQEVIDTANAHIEYAQGIINSYADDVVVAGGTMSNSWATGTTALKNHVRETQTSVSTMSNSWATGTTSIRKNYTDTQNEIGVRSNNMRDSLNNVSQSMSDTETQTTSSMTKMKEEWSTGSTEINGSVSNITSHLESSFTSSYDAVLAKTDAFITELKKKLSNVPGGASGIVLGGAVATYNVPHYAEGHVFAGGSPYLAVVNDQPAGQTNVETPLSVIEDAVRGVVGSGSGGNDAPVYLQVDGKTFARIMGPYMQAENNRIGVNMLKK